VEVWQAGGEAGLAWCLATGGLVVPGGSFNMLKTHHYKNFVFGLSR
jgi:hypothetical protein